MQWHFCRSASTILSGVGNLTAAGYTWALSHAAVPCIISAPEDVLAAAWRTQYLRGFYISRPLCALNALSFGYLARQTTSDAVRYLHIVAAVLSASGVPYALTFLRRTNGALSIRAKKIAGDGEDPTAIALTYARHENRSIDREGAWSTVELVRRWQWHNSIRTAVLVAGTVIGAVALALDMRGVVVST